ncbi:MAG: flagellar hook-basal body complex protein FliE [Proteobacteria bacterium]|nr:flagellar hook-basal body complex protein FliE [Pseudomonadota bacterium]
MVDNVKLNSATSAYQQALTRGISGSGAENGDSVDFGNLVGNVLGDAVSAVKKGEVTGARSLLKQTGVDDLALAVSNAELTLKTVMAIRDRVINAYQDIIKMPI